ncbi:MAG: hypothetical protein ACI9QC_000596 [Oceanicoccus sp.]|jgi:hypothetical protein
MGLSSSSYERHRSEAEDFDPTKLRGLYEQANLWHGTGRYQWRYGDDDIYVGDSSNAQQVDVLDQLLEEGLKPHEDKFAGQFGAEVTCTTSLTRARMYAALYAKLFHSKGESLEYEFGSNLRWGSLFSFGTFLALLKDADVWRDWRTEHWQHIREHGIVSAGRRFIDLQSRATSDQVNWTRNIRRETIPAWKALFSGGVSDIEGNYPILLGIPESVVEAVPAKYGYLGVYETRACNPIALSDCTHMEVPLRYVSEVRGRLSSVGVELSVVPMEDGELFMSRTSYLKLLEMDRS